MSLPPKTFQSNAISPKYIFILGGGYNPGTESSEDILTEDSSRRLLHGINVWLRSPDAFMVFSGAVNYGSLRPLTRHSDLMKEVALSHGVFEKMIITEPHSLNTREHAIEGIKIPTINSETPIALITSNWHMRRAFIEFKRYFKNIQIEPVQTLNENFSWHDLMPSTANMNFNTILVQKWVGIVWYYFKWINH